MLSRCKTHLAEAGESYFEHLQFALGVGLMLVAAGLACIIHAIVPGACEKTASRTVGRITTLFTERDELPSILEDTSGALTLVGLLAVASPAWAIVLIAPSQPFAIAAAMLATAIPATYLWTNPQLDPVA